MKNIPPAQILSKKASVRGRRVTLRTSRQGCLVLGPKGNWERGYHLLGLCTPLRPLASFFSLPTRPQESTRGSVAPGINSAFFFLLFFFTAEYLPHS